MLDEILAAKRAELALLQESEARGTQAGTAIRFAKAPVRGRRVR